MKIHRKRNVDNVTGQLGHCIQSAWILGAMWDHVKNASHYFPTQNRFIRIREIHSEN